MRGRIGQWLAGASLAVSLIGCGGAAKTPNQPPAPSPFAPPPNKPAAPVDPFKPAPSEVAGVLAGQLLDEYNRHPEGVSIEITPADKLTSGQAPVDVPALPGGLFVIQGLEPGRTYVLKARVREGSRLLAGTVIARPPDSKLLIKLREDLAGATTPSLPTAPVGTVPRPVPKPVYSPSAPTTAPSTAPPAPNWNGAATTPHPGDGWGPGKVPTPSTAPPTTVAPARAPVVRPEQVAPSNQPAPRPGIPAAVPNSSHKYPFADVSGDQVSNFGAYDLDGQPWTYANQRTGQLVLLDFWGTWCRPCLEALPSVQRLHQRFGPDLEVIGVCCERDLPNKRVGRVRDTLSKIRPALTYRMIMAGDSDRCQLQLRFGIESYPTFILLDRDGRILKKCHHDGLPALEQLISQKLGK
jgi:thiol-disulfide isomerase/thioredoxin